MKNNEVAVFTSEYKKYPEIPPYHPDTLYPEYPFEFVEKRERNVVYEGIRECLRLLKLDSKKYGKKNWNPLGEFIKPGDVVVLKPNLIAESVEYDPEKWEFVITHGSIIRAIVDYVYIALKGKGKIIICDGPQTDSNMELIKERIRIKELTELYKKNKNFDLEFYDLRNEVWETKNGVVVSKKLINEDPEGYITINLKDKSKFFELDNKKKKFYGAYYDIEETNKHHQKGHHEYYFSKLILSANVIINLPKLKTHKKSGVTLNLKNIIGVTGNRNWLPHYIFGTPKVGGDQYSEKNGLKFLEEYIVKYAKSLLKRNNSILKLFITKLKLKQLGYRIFGSTSEVLRSGNWYGNDTVWRMIIDLNTILHYADKEGNLNFDEKRKFFSIVDGIIGMQGNGPMAGIPYFSGIIVAGKDFFNVDLTCTKLMGFDYKKIRLYNEIYKEKNFPLFSNKYEEILVLSNNEIYNKFLKDIRREDTLHFIPHFGWLNYIEL